MRIDASPGFWVKLLDFSDLSQDAGLYVAGDSLVFFPLIDASSGSIIQGEDFVFVLSQSADGATRGYLNGELQFTLGGGDNAVPLNNVLHLLRDDSTTGGLETATGSIDYVRVYDRALDDEQVAALMPPPPDILGDTIGSRLLASTDNNFWTVASTDPVFASVTALAPEFTDPAFGSFNITVDVDQNIATVTMEGFSFISQSGLTITLSDLDFETDLVGFELIDNDFPGAPSNVGVTSNSAVTLTLPTIQGLDAGDLYQMSFEFVTQRSADPDGDGVFRDADNCLSVSNPDQTDSDADGFGNACDADLNADCVVNAVDLGLLRVAFFSSPGAANWNPDADLNADETVNVQDLGIMRSLFFQSPGPSALAACSP